MDEVRAGLPILTFPHEAAFSAWLGANGASVPGIWLTLAKKGAPAPSVTKAEAIDAALCHGGIDGQLDKYDGHHWLTRFTPRKPRSRWSEVNRARAAALADKGRTRPASLAQIEFARADGRWDAAYAPASTAAPDDLAAALAASPAAAAFFATLKGPSRYAVLYWIGAVKMVETRARKITEFVGMLERGEILHGRLLRPLIRMTFENQRHRVRFGRSPCFIAGPRARTRQTDSSGRSRYRRLMPEGTRHEFIGLLTATPTTLVLKLQDGRQWTLVAPLGIDRFIDHKVRVSGTRGEDSVLFVDAFAREG